MLIAVVFVVAFSLAACQRQSQPTEVAQAAKPVQTAPQVEARELHIANWPDYIQEGAVEAFEKETGVPNDRPLVAGVFINRLRIGMRLQTDPTVIYGLGAAFDGNLRRRDLLADTPWNTYTRAGLPPTPMAMPGQASLLAAVQPSVTPAFYFVARGDGSSQFSVSLDEHNRAVNRYQRGQTP